MTARTAHIGLGANLGDREATLREAVRSLAALGEIVAVSSLYETEPIGYADQPPFLNAVVALKTARTPDALMQGLLDIERTLGRTRSFRNAPRTVDLDLLLMGDCRIDSPDLTLPHPRMHERAFVLVPLAEIAPGLVHPGCLLTVRELLDSRPDYQGVRRFAGPGWTSTQTMDEGTLPDRSGNHGSG